MLNRSASLAMSTSVLKALPGKLDIKRHSPSILYTSSLRVYALMVCTVRLIGAEMIVRSFSNLCQISEKAVFLN